MLQALGLAGNQIGQIYSLLSVSSFGFYLNKNKGTTVLEKLSQQSVLLCHCKHFSWCHRGISSVNRGCTCLQSSLNQTQAEQVLLGRSAGFEVQFPSFGASHFPYFIEHATAPRYKLGLEKAAGRNMRKPSARLWEDKIPSLPHTSCVLRSLLVLVLPLCPHIPLSVAPLSLAKELKFSNNNQWFKTL